MKRIGLLVLVLVLVAMAGALILWQLGPKPADQPASSKLTVDMLSQAVEVVAIAENGKDYRRAIDGWTKLLQSRPDDRDLLLNQAVTVLKWIADTQSTLSSNTVSDPDEVASLQTQLQDAIAEADRIVGKLAANSSDQAAASNQVLLEALYLETKSRTVDAEQSAQLRKTAAEKLIAALEARPDQVLLAGRLIEMEQELKLDWPEVTAKTTELIYRAWKAEPRNLLLLMRSGQGLADLKDKRLLEVVEASMEIAKPLLPMLPSAKQAQPEQLLQAVRDVATSGDWSKPPRVFAWFNVLRGSPAYQADNKRLTPDVMALLNTSFLERWRQQLLEAGQLRAVKPTPCQFSSTTLTNSDAANKSKPALVAWYDYQVDKDFDATLVQGNQLIIVPRGSDSPAPVSLVLPFEPSGMAIADLWTVDSPQRPRVKRSAEAVSQPGALITSNSHDTVQELILWNAQQLCIVSPDPATHELKLLAEVPGLSTIAGIERIAVMELDGDGDLDLVVSTATGLKVLQNNGNRTFEDITAYSSLPPADWKPTGMLAGDYDRDLDLDLVLTSSSAPHVAVLENILHSQLRFLPLDAAQWQGEQPLIAGHLLEVDGNASWDACWLGKKSVMSVLTRTPGPGQVVVKGKSQFEVGAEGQYSWLHPGDVNLDGQADMVVAGAGGLKVLLGDTNSPATEAVPVIDQAASGLDVQDADSDGQLEILTCVAGELREVRVAPAKEGSSESANKFVNMRIRGQNDNKGGRINHYGIGSTLEVWSNGRYQARVVEDPSTHFGLGPLDATDVRVIFNNGLTQNVLHPKSNSSIEEMQELKGSCPFVYGWDGERFQMITDLLWNAPLGLQVARGQPLPDRRWEYLMLPGRLVQPHDGAIELRVTEELWEVAYFDHVTLTAVDHPQDVDVWTNEKVGPPQLAEPRLFTASQPIRPTAARDGYGRDCLELLAKRDRQFVQAFQQQICQGLCEPHSLELSFDPAQLKVRHDLRLVITGWMHPTDTSLNIAISQNPELDPPAPPALWAPDASGQFVCKQPFMGFPGGKPKTIVVDLQDVFTGDDTRLRIESSQQIYWDEAYLVVNEPPVPMLSQSLPLQSARLHYRGFGALMPRADDQPHWYDYHQVSQRPKWPPLEGVFSRYGDVLPQMSANDDHLVVMASGDEMILRFAVPRTELPAGWTRDYVLHSAGWDKDADLNTLEGQSSLPLPYAGMHAYPPTFQQQAESEAVWKLNAPDLAPRPAFRNFWKAQVPSLDSTTGKAR